MKTLILLLFTIYLVYGQPGQFLYTYETRTPVITNKVVRDEICVTCLPGEKTKTIQEVSFKTEGYAVYQTQARPTIWDTVFNTYEAQNRKYYDGMRQYRIY